MNTTKPPQRRSPRLLALGLLILAPLCAEYITGYDTSTGRPLALVGGLLILSPLYGGPALWIRELARRFGVGWPGLMALAAAFGIVQAGVVDQSLFSKSYREIEYWEIGRDLGLHQTTIAYSHPIHPKQLALLDR